MANLTFKVNGEDYSLEGVSSDVYIELAKLGAKQILKGRSDPQESWSRIRKGDFGRKPPKVIPREWIALARLNQDTDENAVKWGRTWRDMTRADKKKWRKNPLVKLTMAKIELEQSREGDNMGGQTP
jgi:hypothetical protein